MKVQIFDSVYKTTYKNIRDLYTQVGLNYNTTSSKGCSFFHRVYIFFIVELGEKLNFFSFLDSLVTPVNLCSFTYNLDPKFKYFNTLSFIHMFLKNESNCIYIFICTRNLFLD